jgi:c-di-GMP-binding flagellar brake protein YcgR
MPIVDTRKYRRFSIQVPCMIQPTRRRARLSSAPVSAETRDISKGGMRFVVDEGWKIGTAFNCVLKLRIDPFSLEPVEIHCRGKIVRIIGQEPGRYEIGATIDHYTYRRRRKGREMNPPTAA